MIGRGRGGPAAALIMCQRRVLAVRTPCGGVADDPEVVRADRGEVPHQRHRNGDRRPDATLIMQEQAFAMVAFPPAGRVHHQPAFIRREHANAAVIAPVGRSKWQRDRFPWPTVSVQQIALAGDTVIARHPSFQRRYHRNAVEERVRQGIVHRLPGVIKVAQDQAGLRGPVVWIEHGPDQPSLRWRRQGQLEDRGAIRQIHGDLPRCRRYHCHPPLIVPCGNTLRVLSRAAGEYVIHGTGKRTTGAAGSQRMTVSARRQRPSTGSAPTRRPAPRR